MNTPRNLAALVLAFLAAGADAAPQLWTLETRRNETDGNTITLPILVERPTSEVPLKGILISMDTGSAKNLIKTDGDTPSYGQPTTLVTRVRQHLLNKGIAILTPGTPSDRPEGIDAQWRENNEHRGDIEALVGAARKEFPGAPVIMHGYFSGATSVLSAAMNRIPGIDGYAITSGMVSKHREDWLSRIKTRGIVIQPVSHRCDSIPTPEAREIATAARWQFIEAGDNKVDTKPTCTTNSRAGLAGLDEAFADLLTHWIVGDTVASTFGHSPAKLAYYESVFMVPGASRGLFGKMNIEVSLFTPPGQGPFPLVVFNHGDVIDGPSLARKQRFRVMSVTNEFLALGFAVAFPARPGVGRSEGIYKTFSGASKNNLGTSTHLLQKGQEHMEEGLAALNYLKTLPQIDANRVIMSGQSAGGFAVSTLGLETPVPSWLKAIVNFSGGRTDAKNDEIATGLNREMVEIFGLLGKTSRIPSLWIFAENDSRYTAETIRASHEAFTQAGGVAKLVMHPPSQGDGHFIYNEPEKWRGELRNFLAQQGLIKAATQKSTSPTPPATPKPGHAKLSQADND